MAFYPVYNEIFSFFPLFLFSPSPSTIPLQEPTIFGTLLTFDILL